VTRHGYQGDGTNEQGVVLDGLMSSEERRSFPKRPEGQQTNVDPLRTHLSIHQRDLGLESSELPLESSKIRNGRTRRRRRSAVAKEAPTAEGAPTLMFIEDTPLVGITQGAPQ
jgi:hypothetical protein